MRKYVIIPSEPSQAIVDVCIQTSMATLRYNNARTHVVLKYDLPQPIELAGVKEYTHKEILIEMAKPEWQSED